jgi:hypothetical protein
MKNLRILLILAALTPAIATLGQDSSATKRQERAIKRNYSQGYVKGLRIDKRSHDSLKIVAIVVKSEDTAKVKLMWTNGRAFSFNAISKKHSNLLKEGMIIKAVRRQTYLYFAVNRKMFVLRPTEDFKRSF